VYVLYFPRGGPSEIDLRDLQSKEARARWFDPRAGQWREGPALRPGRSTVVTPMPADWALLVQANPTLNTK
jgi:hypothetical protein